MIFFSLAVLRAHAQGNYEIQVYGAPTVSPRTTMVELHSNFTVQGQRYDINGVYPTHHQLHETIEITTGISNWAEVGWYIFTSAPSSAPIARAYCRM